MDLRWRLSSYLALFFGVLLIAVAGGSAVSLKHDVGEEIDASVRMLELMSAAAKGDGSGVEALARDGVRHIRVGLTRDELLDASGPQDAWWVRTVTRWLAADRAREAQIRQIDVGGLTLYVKPNPESEISEIVQDVGRWIATILAFSLLTSGMVWFAVGRALAPARELKSRIDRLDGADGKHLAPHNFALQEFNMLSDAVDDMARKLAVARAAQRSLSQCLISVQESERKDIARELHDEFGQSLTAISLSAAYIERHSPGEAMVQQRQAAADICGQADYLAQHLRALLSRLRPYGLDSVGLIETMRDCVRSWQDRRPGVRVVFDPPERLPVTDPGKALFLYRGLQEALTNIARHSDASRVVISIVESADQIEMTISDDGVGVDDSGAGQGVGLMGMAERAAMVGGSFGMVSSPGHGCTVKLTLPAGDEADDSKNKQSKETL